MSWTPSPGTTPEDNTGAGMPAIHVKPGKKFTVTVLPKGAGAENMSRIAMLLPSQKDEIEKFVVETMLSPGHAPAPRSFSGSGSAGHSMALRHLPRKPCSYRSIR